MKVAIAILTSVVAALAFAGCGRKDVPPGEVKPVAQQLRPRSGTDIEGQEHPLFDSSNRGVLFVFTLQDRPIANAYAPKIQRIQSRYETQGIRFFLVHVDPAASLAQLRQHQEDYGYRCTILHDKEHQLVAIRPGDRDATGGSF